MVSLLVAIPAACSCVGTPVNRFSKVLQRGPIARALDLRINHRRSEEYKNNKQRGNHPTNHTIHNNQVPQRNLASALHWAPSPVAMIKEVSGTCSPNHAAGLPTHTTKGATCSPVSKVDPQ